MSDRYSEGKVLITISRTEIGRILTMWGDEAVMREAIHILTNSQAVVEEPDNSFSETAISIYLREERIETNANQSN